ncbi:substrate binding domain-containing protein [Ramlibacter tataouinensis]|uniref:substrate binding domain-containing protein n=1 Tax=Ramlibacter tataouinensis TaxID=94132 RepID=UPI0022F3E7FC|nr:substrate binding domain-containing protein [Ramlibacter tataouinensis]WBY02762.1 substrate binding domain-containing protein [Ramlibacter tataouinensis]
MVRTWTGFAMPVVSQRVKRITPASMKASMRLQTPEGRTSPSNGKPNAVEIASVTGRPAGSEPAPAQLEGDLRVLASPSFTSSVLLRELHPGLLVDLRVSAGPVDLIREGIDVHISLDEIHRKKQPAVKLADHTCVVCASPAYLERHGIPGTPADLRRHAGLVGHGSPFAEEWPFLAGRTVRKYPVRKVFASNNGDALRAYCVQGLGLGGFYAFHVAEDLRLGRLVEVLRPYRANASAIYAVVQHRRYMSPHTRAFIEFMRAACAKLATGNA